MKIKVWAVPLISADLMVCTLPGTEKYQTIMDSVTTEKVSRIISSDVIPSVSNRHREMISHVSSAFPAMPYQANPPIDGSDTPEALAADFNGVDCFTPTDCVEIQTRSHEKQSFLHSRARIRYTGDSIDSLSRRHFFSDRSTTAPRHAREVMEHISSDYAIADTLLNRQPDGREHISGLGTHTRKINGTQEKVINPHVLYRMKNKDYVGCYSPLEGLDVSHVNSEIPHDCQLWFRNTSSLAANRKRVDSLFLEYIRPKPGIAVLLAEHQVITGAVL